MKAIIAFRIEMPDVAFRWQSNMGPHLMRNAKSLEGMKQISFISWVTIASMSGIWIITYDCDILQLICEFPSIFNALLGSSITNLAHKK